MRRCELAFMLSLLSELTSLLLYSMPRKSYLLSGGVLPASSSAATGLAATLAAPIPSRNRPTSRYTSDGAPSVMPSEATSEGRILVASYPDAYSDRTIYP